MGWFAGRVLALEDADAAVAGGACWEGDGEGAGAFGGVNGLAEDGGGEVGPGV